MHRRAPRHRIRCVFLAEFDNSVGPRISAQVPEDYVSPEDFDAVSEYIITKPDLCGRIASVVHHAFRSGRGSHGPMSGRTPGFAQAPGAHGATEDAEEDASPTAAGPACGAKILAFPVSLQAEKYPRNTLLFSVGMVLDVDADTRPYEAVLEKLGMALYSMEIESELLFRPQRKALLGPALRQVLDGLNARGECFVSVDDCDTLALKLFPVLADPPEVRANDVPVRLRDLEALMGEADESGWDISLRIVAAHIDGATFVRAIAEEADMDLDVVKRALQHLLYYGCVTMVDVFQYANIYATTPRVQLLLRSRALREACLRYITVDDHMAEALAAPLSMSDVAGTPVSPGQGATVRSAQTAPLASPTMASAAVEAADAAAVAFEYVYRLYTAFGAGSRVADVCAQGDTEGLGVDDRRFITFGVIHGLLRRIHKYPVRNAPPVLAPVADVHASQRPGGAAPVHPLMPKLVPLLDGVHSLEEICCALSVSEAEVETCLQSDSAFAVVLR